MAYAAALISFAFVKRGIMEGKPVTQMKVQKMVYFAHGYHLAKYGTPLITEGFEAWKFGPVIPSIYETYKLYGSEDIVDTTLIPDEQHLELELAELGARAEDAINYTWDATGDVSARDLSAWTHKPDSPWAEAFKPDTMSIPIRNDRIEKYFTGVLTSNG
ncbi:MAG TPA: type II toxin-antitoxin system antitoxin SocA domain-containing protein [Dinghuibacter sp.]|uniref:Panacea domain-containing protein n=1 Tax=Dinghuibacter sp. TaxID=2024697 RepID=UPI002BDDBA16|nr:type II toxin-antitoxin system antitoxin SocA domain-containing protein [Dinghuibacter sp.]HTJ13500.1 type II toxin-antitoxin system antitoxin SocA domain-containing protein [Dinghuibacter sp.]